MTENKEFKISNAEMRRIEKAENKEHLKIEEENKKITLKCHRCKYIWETKSKKKFVSCPDCLTKVKVKEYKA